MISVITQTWKLGDEGMLNIYNASIATQLSFYGSRSTSPVAFGVAVNLKEKILNICQCVAVAVHAVKCHTHTYVYCMNNGHIHMYVHTLTECSCNTMK